MILLQSYTGHLKPTGLKCIVHMSQQPEGITLDAANWKHHRSARLIRKRNQRKNCKRNPNGSQEAAQQDRQVHCNVDQVCLSAHVKPEEHVWCCSLPPVIFHFPKILVVIISS